MPRPSWLLVVLLPALAAGATMEECSLSEAWNTCSTEMLTMGDGPCPPSCVSAVTNEGDCIAVFKDVVGPTLGASL